MPAGTTMPPIAANTAIVFQGNVLEQLGTRNSLGIVAGLVIGKFIGIFLGAYLAVKSGIAALGSGLGWRQISGVAFLGGIGFTMSIFISNLAFTDANLINESKISILAASLIASLVGLYILKRSNRQHEEKVQEQKAVV